MAANRSSSASRAAAWFGQPGVAAADRAERVLVTGGGSTGGACAAESMIGALVSGVAGSSRSGSGGSGGITQRPPGLPAANAPRAEKAPPAAAEGEGEGDRMLRAVALARGGAEYGLARGLPCRPVGDSGGSCASRRLDALSSSSSISEGPGRSDASGALGGGVPVDAPGSSRSPLVFAKDSA